MLEITSHRVIAISQTHYIQDLPKIDPSTYLADGLVRCGKDLRFSMRKFAGAIIWIRRTRHEVGINITKIATEAASECRDGDLDAKFIVFIANQLDSCRITIAQRITHLKGPDLLHPLSTGGIPNEFD